MTDRLRLEVIRTTSGRVTQPKLVRAFKEDEYIGYIPVTKLTSVAEFEKEIFFLELDGHFVTTRVLDTPYPDEPHDD